MQYLTAICVVALSILLCSCTDEQSKSQPAQEPDQFANKPKSDVSRDQIDALLAETAHLIIPDLEKKHPGKVFTIEWKVEGEAVMQISIRRDKPPAEIIMKDYDALKTEISKLPKVTSVSYIFPDDRLDLLTNKQITELYGLCKRNGSFFYLHKGG